MGAMRTGAGRLSLTPMPVIHLAALSVASFGCAFDLRTRRIPNWLTFGATAVAITPGWLRSEMMLDHFGVSEENWREAFDRPTAEQDQPSAPADFALSESPRYVGRAVVALASDPGRERWNQSSVSSGQLALEYGFTDLDGSQPDIWRYIEEIQEPGLHADPNDYR